MKKSSFALLSASALAAFLVITRLGAAELAPVPDFKALAPTSGKGVPPPPECGGKPGVVYILGVADNFVRPKPTTMSPELTAFFKSRNLKSRQFDEGGINRVFGHSFKIKESCKICAVQVEIKMRQEGGGQGNDTIVMFGKTIDTAGVLWTAQKTGPTGTQSPGTVVMTEWLQPIVIKKLNDHMLANAPGYWINFIAQDDHAIDYIKVTIFYD